MKLKENIVFLWMKESVGEGWMVDVGFLVGGWWLRDETSKLSVSR